MKVLVLAAHPAFERSIVNQTFTRVISDLDGIKVHDLYETYPDFLIDVKAEQELLLSHDLIVLQHPFFWYSAPALLKEWIDLVLEHGWAYGQNGTHLAGKFMINVISTGGGADAYHAKGTNRHTIREFLAPFDQTARLCNMTYLPPFVSFQGRRVESHELRELADNYRAFLTGACDDVIDLKKLARFELCNNAIGKIFGNTEIQP